MTAAPDLNFRSALLAGQPLFGSFIKTPGACAIEILGEVGLDFVVVDAEHAPWDRGDIDHAILAAKSQCLPALVRVESKAHILTALDCGASGVMVPHISSAQIARDAVAACRYRAGMRGFSNSPRAGRYGGLGLADHVQNQDAHTTVIAMLEDPQALTEIDAIAQVDGIDAFFLGRGDLTVALGESSADAPRVRAAIETFVHAIQKVKKPLCAFVGKTAEIPALQSMGITTFIVSSDQGLMRQAATSELDKFRGLLK
jgi:2-keto-3-deoxy-L-rhamnonate aldolase RhmA